LATAASSQTSSAGVNMLRASLQAPKRLIGDYCGAERFRRAHPARCAQSIVIAGARNPRRSL
jgi:hypothetical protein